jgi:muramoyltetrapeptide carboxypeptidase
MGRTLYLWCPAYALRDHGELVLARGATDELARALGMATIESPFLGRLGNPGSWGSADERVEDLERALDHDLLVAARGGYGCLDLVEHVLRSPRTRAGMLIGYSDLTVLHACWHRRGWGETIYGFLPALGGARRARESTAALAGGAGLRIDAHSDGAVEALRPGTADGTVFAACLSVLAGLAGTPAMPDLRGRILALEDIDERPYRIDRALRQLDLAQALSGIAGLVFAHFPSEQPSGYGGPSARDICRQWAQRLGVPAIFGLGFGHHPDPLSLACGRAARLYVDAAGPGWSLAIHPRA